MHIASVGVSKLCFLLSLAFCGLLLLLIPAVQHQAGRVDLPQPRAQARPTHTGQARPTHTGQARPTHTGQARPTHTGQARPTHTGQARPTHTGLQQHAKPPAVSVHHLHTGLNRSSAGQTEGTMVHSPSPNRGKASNGKAGGLSGSGSRDPLELKDIFIAVKTTRKYHKSRLELLIQTWVSQAKEQTYIFTDGEDRELQTRTGVNLINTNCSAAHTRQALCCKMSVEYDKFIESQKKWFCHVDDDNYVLVLPLVALLSSYHHSQDVYVGRPSLDHPIEAAERVKSDGSVSVKFWFATGGAGFCISRGLALKMSPWASLGNFISTAEKIRLPDDCTIGYIIEALLEVPLTHTHLFHSHLESLLKLPTDTVLQQVTLSYGGFDNRRNVVSLVGGFSLAEDPTRFKTVHCLLYAQTDWCPQVQPHHSD